MAYLQHIRQTKNIVTWPEWRARIRRIFHARTVPLYFSAISVAYVAFGSSNERAPFPFRIDLGRMCTDHLCELGRIIQNNKEHVRSFFSAISVNVGRRLFKVPVMDGDISFLCPECMKETVLTSIDRSVRSRKGRVLNNKCWKVSKSQRVLSVRSIVIDCPINVIRRYQFSLHSLFMKFYRVIIKIFIRCRKKYYIFCV